MILFEVWDGEQWYPIGSENAALLFSGLTIRVVSK